MVGTPYQGSASRARRLTAGQFAAKWTLSTLKERSAAQEHFIDLCHLLDEPTPAQADPHGDWYCFERGARKTGGGEGWADVWKKGCFAWEYKGKHKNLETAFAQLQRYAIALENPPILVVSDMDRIEVHTNFTNTVQDIYSIPISDIGMESNLKVLKDVFSNPEKLQPGKTVAAITEEAAQRFARLAQMLRNRGGEPQRVAHFLNRVLFCLYAQDARLLPPGIVVQLLETGMVRPDEANQMFRSLFMTMKKGGVFGPHVIDWFNGNLFDSNDAVPLEAEDISELLSVARLDWSAIEPSIIGTLFERGLDPEKRAQIGAHYTDPKLIMRIVSPVVLDPLSAKWERSRTAIERLMRDAGSTHLTEEHRSSAQRLYDQFLDELANYRVLDPACGSGNFLYLALQALKDLEHRAALEAEQLGLTPDFAEMRVGVQCVRGIELNVYAAELARVSVWIGEIQWMLRHGLRPARNPILKSLETIECRDAILSEDGSEPIWPKVDAIIGNPPFLGDKKMLGDLGKRYVQSLRSLYRGRVPGGADLVTYWFEKARLHIEQKGANAAGLVATNSIRGGASRRVLDGICEELEIFNAWSDLDWVTEGAAVRVSLVCFAQKRNGDTVQGLRLLNGAGVIEVFADLTGVSKGASSRQRSDAQNLTLAAPLLENKGCSFIGTQKSGPFEIPGSLARDWLNSPNPHRRPNSDVVKPWINGLDITRRPQDLWIVDFGVDRPASEAALYEKPYSYVRDRVKPMRDRVERTGHRKYWWRHGETRSGMRVALRSLPRYIAIPRVSKHRVFAWVDATVVPDCQIVVIAKADDATFGVMHSRFHRLWSLRMGSSLEDRPRYTPTTSFETFPFPAGITPRETSTGTRANSHIIAISEAAIQLNRLRENWLNPPDWVSRVPEVKSGFPERTIALEGKEKELKTRTITNLYNEAPAWLLNAHLTLDVAVAKAYGWADYTADMPDESILRRLLQLNLQRSQSLFSEHNKPNRSVTAGSSQKGPTTLPLSSTHSSPDAAFLDRRLAVVCTLVNRLADDRHFGRTKLAKIFYLADSTQDLRLDTTYYRQAAGPLDPVALYNAETGLEALAAKHGYLHVENTGKKVKYRRGSDIEKGLNLAREVLGGSRVAINRLIDLFRPLNTDQCEIVATLYACWNDSILDRKTISDEAIADDFRNAWHERKRRFAPSRLIKALAWMRKNGIVPDGRAAHTRTVRAQLPRRHRPQTGSPNA